MRTRHAPCPQKFIALLYIHGVHVLLIQVKRCRYKSVDLCSSTTPRTPCLKQNRSAVLAARCQQSPHTSLAIPYLHPLTTPPCQRYTVTTMARGVSVMFLCAAHYAG